MRPLKRMPQTSCVGDRTTIARSVQVSIGQLLLITALVAITFAFRQSINHRVVCAVLAAAALWWLVGLEFSTPKILRLPLSSIYVAIVAFAATCDIWKDSVSPTLQSLAFALLVALGIKRALSGKGQQTNRAANVYTTIIAGVVLAMGLVPQIAHSADGIHFSKMWLLGSTVFLWLHTKLWGNREKPIRWLDMLSAVMLWLGWTVLVAFGLGFVGCCFFLEEGLQWIGPVIFGFFATTIFFWSLSLGMVVRLFASPKPFSKMFVVSYFACITALVGVMIFQSI